MRLRPSRAASPAPSVHGPLESPDPAPRGLAIAATFVLAALFALVASLTMAQPAGAIVLCFSGGGVSPVTEIPALGCGGVGGGPPPGPNTEPVAANDEFNVSGTGTYTFVAPGILANDNDVDGDTISVTSVEPFHVDGATITFASTGAVTITTNGLSPGTLFDTAYDISDGRGGTSRASITVHVVGTPAPQTASDRFSVTAGQVTTIPAANGLLANDRSLTGTPLVVAGWDDVANVVISDDGSLTVDATDLAAGAMFGGTYQARHTSGPVSPWTAFVVTVISQPLAVMDSLAPSDEDTQRTIPFSALLANDEGTGLTVTAVTGLTGASVELTADGVLVRPYSDFSGTAGFNYTITDSAGATDTGFASFEVTPVNDRPFVNATSVPNSITVPATSSEGATATWAVHGFDRETVYVPIPATCTVPLGPGGSDIEAISGVTVFPRLSTTTVTCIVTDSEGLASEPDQFDVTVTNASPIARRDSFVIPVNGTLDYPAPGFLENDTDPDGGTLAVVVPPNGTLTGVTWVSTVSGGITFTSDGTATPGTYPFTYLVGDGQGGSAMSYIDLIVPSNAAPSAGDDAYTVYAGETTTIPAAQGLLANDSDPDGDDLAVTGVTGFAAGLVSANADGSLVITAPASVAPSGSDVAGSYTVQDTTGAGDTAAITLRILPRPATTADALGPFPEDFVRFSSSTSFLLGNDTGVGLSVTGVSGATLGTATLSGTTVFFEPAADAYGAGGFSYTVTDERGTETTGYVTVTLTPVNDRPSIGPAPADASVTATSAAGATVTFTAPTATDPDSAASGRATPVTCATAGGPVASGATFPVGTTVVTCTATDARVTGDTGAAYDDVAVTFTVTVSAPAGPSFAVTPNALTVAEDAAATTFTPVASAPEGSTLSFELVAPLAGLGTATIDPATGVVTYTPGADVNGADAFTIQATDQYDQSATLTVTVTITAVNDPPVIAPSSVPSDRTVEATGPGGAVVTFPAPTTTDTDAAPSTASCLPASGGTFPLGTTTVTCTADDGAGGTDTVTFVVTVRDTTAPALSLPSPVAAAATGPAGAPVDFTASATDLVDGPLTPACVVPAEGDRPVASGATFALGTTTVSCSATDAARNRASGTFTVTVTDGAAPVLALPSALTAEATGPDGALVTYAATASDAVDGAVTPSCAPASGERFPLGVTTVSCQATDSARNTSGTGTFPVTVRDTTAPAVTLSTVPGSGTPRVLAVAATGERTTVRWDPVTATDAVSGTVTLACRLTPGADPIGAAGTTFPVGDTPVTCSAADGAGNPVATTFTVRVGDGAAPVLSLPTAAVTAEATSLVGAVVRYAATARDVVDGDVTPVCSPASGSTFRLGSTTVSCTATDRAGNVARGAFTVTIRDTTAPAFTGTPAAVTVPATANSGAVVTYGLPAARDTADASVSVTCSPASGGLFAIGTTTVTCVATDDAGLRATVTFAVTVTHNGFRDPRDPRPTTTPTVPPTTTPTTPPTPVVTPPTTTPTTPTPRPTRPARPSR